MFLDNTQEDKRSELLGRKSMPDGNLLLVDGENKHLRGVGEPLPE
jgi:hypothetical protein